MIPIESTSETCGASVGAGLRPAPTTAAPLLELSDVVKHFPSKDGRGTVKAVDGVSLTLGPGETLGIVGESGCGKSTLARLMLRLTEPTAGQVRFAGEDLLALGSRAMRARRRDMQIVFQDPYAALDSRLPVGAIIAEPLEIHRVGDRQRRRQRVAELLSLVGLEADAATRYPHEFSGGQRQRIGIARAIALEPKLVVLDEPVSALDVSIQSQILNLLMDLKTRLGLSYVFISHDLAVVEHVSDRVAVMYLGRVVETTDTAALYARPAHPYTEALMSAVVEPDPARRAQRIVLQGDPPSPESPPTGCSFHPRCPKMMERCAREPPLLRNIGADGAPHRVSCHLY
ncbi:MAG: ABC transporter ATP-binding protein [Dongiaceae bacterium]